MRWVAELELYISGIRQKNSNRWHVPTGYSHIHCMYSNSLEPWLMLALHWCSLPGLSQEEEIVARSFRKTSYIQGHHTDFLECMQGRLCKLEDVLNVIDFVTVQRGGASGVGKLIFTWILVGWGGKSSFWFECSHLMLCLVFEAWTFLPKTVRRVEIAKARWEATRT
jgi:hypothetical protein